MLLILKRGDSETGRPFAFKEVEMSENFKNLKLSSDTHIKVGKEDIFENDKLVFKPSVERLASLMESIKPPFTIGVYGNWGSGKTSYMDLLKSVLEKDGRYKTVWFDSWKYENEGSLIAPLLSCVMEELDLKNDNGTLKSAVKIGSALALLSTKALTGGLLGASDITEAFKTYEGLSEEKYKNWKSSVDTMRDNFDGLVKEGNDGSDKPLIIFIDDLDRCMPENAVKFLENIKHYLLAENVIFVIGVDKEVLSRGIEARYGTQLISGEEYLEKIINLGVLVPKKGVDGLIQNEARYVLAGTGTTDMAEKIDEFSRVLTLCGVDNARKVKLLTRRYVFFLLNPDSRLYHHGVIVKLLITKELLPEYFELRRLNSNIFSDMRLLNSKNETMEKGEIVDFYGKDVASIYSTRKYDMLVYIHSGLDKQDKTIPLIDRSEEDLKRIINVRGTRSVGGDAEHIMARKCLKISANPKERAHKYLDMVDFLFSLS